MQKYSLQVIFPFENRIDFLISRFFIEPYLVIMHIDSHTGNKRVCAATSKNIPWDMYTQQKLCIRAVRLESGRILGW